MRMMQHMLQDEALCCVITALMVFFQLLVPRLLACCMARLAPRHIVPCEALNDLERGGHTESFDSGAACVWPSNTEPLWRCSAAQRASPRLKLVYTLPTLWRRGVLLFCSLSKDTEESVCHTGLLV